jgi:hypothetical protein
MIGEDMEKIMKEWPEEFQTPIIDAKLSNADIIGIPLVTWFEHVRKTSAKKKKKKEEVQNIETDEEDIASEESGPGSPAGGGGDKVNGQGGGDEEEKQGEGEATSPKDPPTET